MSIYDPVHTGQIFVLVFGHIWLCFWSFVYTELTIFVILFLSMVSGARYCGFSSIGTITVQANRGMITGTLSGMKYMYMYCTNVWMFHDKISKRYRIWSSVSKNTQAHMAPSLSLYHNQLWWSIQSVHAYARCVVTSSCVQTKLPVPVKRNACRTIGRYCFSGDGEFLSFV